MKILSVIVPCRNERESIAAFSAGVLGQVLPTGWQSELLIADGASDDGTRALLGVLAGGDPRVKVIDNPGRIVSSGLNLALAAARGEVVVRMDVHTEYAPDYIAQCIAALAASGADNVGGPWHAQAADGAEATQRAVAAAFQSRWVTGGALSRQLGYSGFVDTVYLGCWPRATFDRFGAFDEALVRNQDDEHNLRIRLGGGRIWQSARIRSIYRPRARLSQVLQQQLQYGYWKAFVVRKHGQPAKLRHGVPGAAVAVLGVCAVLAVIGRPTFLLAVSALYGGVLLAMAAAAARAGRLDAAAALRVPAAIAAVHAGYGVGSLLGVWDVLRRSRGRDRFATLTR